MSINNINTKSQSILRISEKNRLYIKEAKKREEEQGKNIASGKKINSASDDTAGFAIAQKIYSQIQGLDMGSKNAQDGISLIQTAEGGLSQVNDMVTRARELTIRAGSPAISDQERKILQNEISQLGEGISDIAKNTEFNGKPLLDGSQGELSLQVGANEGQFSNVDLSTDFSAMGDALQNIDLSSDLGTALETLDNIQETISNSRAELGANSNALENTINSLDTSSINASASKSIIEDTDVAKAVMEQVRYSLRRDASTVMQAQSQDLLSNISKVLS